MRNSEAESGSKPCWLRGRVVLGLWPIAGVTTMGVTPERAAETIDAALDAGIRSFDTAYSYGIHGESDRYLGEALRRHASSIARDDVTIISKVAQRYSGGGDRYVDARPGTLTSDAESSLDRLGVEKFDVLMLHSIDDNVDVRVSAEALQALRRRGLTDHVGICNADESQRATFASIGPSVAIQCPLNLLQREMLDERILPATRDGHAALTYWALMKGLLAGKISRDHVFADGDSRPKYEIFQGQSRERAHCLVDRLREIGRRWDRSVADLAVSWVLSQPGVAGVLTGAHRPRQVHEFATAKTLPATILAEIDEAVATTQNGTDP